MVSVADITGQAASAKHAVTAECAGRRRRGKRRVLAILLVISLVIGSGFGAAHSHGGSEGGAQACTLCHLTESDWGPTVQSTAAVVPNPETVVRESSSSADLPGWHTAGLQRSRSPPS